MCYSDFSRFSVLYVLFASYFMNTLWTCLFYNINRNLGLIKSDIHSHAELEAEKNVNDLCRVCSRSDLYQMKCVSGFIYMRGYKMAYSGIGWCVYDRVSMCVCVCVCICVCMLKNVRGESWTKTWKNEHESYYIIILNIIFNISVFKWCIASLFSV